MNKCFWLALSLIMAIPSLYAIETDSIQNQRITQERNSSLLIADGHSESEPESAQESPSLLIEEETLRRSGEWIEDHLLHILIGWIFLIGLGKTLCRFTDIIPIWGLKDLIFLSLPWVFWIPWTIWVMISKQSEAELMKVSAIIMGTPLVVSISFSFIGNGVYLHYAILSLLLKLVLFPLIPLIGALIIRSLTLGVADGRYSDGTKGNQRTVAMVGMGFIFDFLLGDFVRVRRDVDA